MHEEKAPIRIGCASGFWGDSAVGAPQLVHSGQIDYLVFDYLAETTMAILAAARLKRPDAGYATDFVDVTMKDILPEIVRRDIKVISNAGGINPAACARAIDALAASMGLHVEVAVVEGDDLSALMPDLARRGTVDMFTGEPVPARVLSANAYLGAWPIVRALAGGAQIVITGRCVDSAVTLAPLIHEFGWKASDLDRLSGGSLAGHIIECGCQATGGLHTDWRSVPDWPDIGYPIVECREDGSFVLTKPAGTGGLVRRACVAEQLLYEIGDPGRYVLPDVVCDWRDVVIEQLDDEHVRVSGARGLTPPSSYKVSATVMNGYRCAGTMVIVGDEAAAKARRTGEAIIERTRRLLRERGMGDCTSATVTLLGAEELYGPHGRGMRSREVMLRVVMDHPAKEALAVFSREIAPSGTSWAPGTTTPAGGRPSPSPLIKQFAFTVPKALVDGTGSSAGDDPPRKTNVAERVDLPSSPRDGPDDGATVDVRLIDLAWARSGDKGNISNVGIVARRPELLPLLWQVLTPDKVRDQLGHLVQGRIERYLVPGIHAMNLVLHDALDGGGPVSRRFDPLGKSMAQLLLETKIAVPTRLLPAP
jgi:hypothetical protein